MKKEIFRNRGNAIIILMLLQFVIIGFVGGYSDIDYQITENSFTTDFVQLEKTNESKLKILESEIEFTNIPQKNLKVDETVLIDDIDKSLKGEIEIIKTIKYSVIVPEVPALTGEYELDLYENGVLIFINGNLEPVLSTFEKESFVDIIKYSDEYASYVRQSFKEEIFLFVLFLILFVIVVGIHYKDSRFAIENRRSILDMTFIFANFFAYVFLFFIGFNHLLNVIFDKSSSVFWVHNELVLQWFLISVSLMFIIYIFEKITNFFTTIYAKMKGVKKDEKSID